MAGDCRVARCTYSALVARANLQVRRRPVGAVELGAAPGSPMSERAAIPRCLLIA
jgi:hypothetical protein